MGPDANHVCGAQHFCGRSVCGKCIESVCPATPRSALSLLDSHAGCFAHQIPPLREPQHPAAAWCNAWSPCLGPRQQHPSQRRAAGVRTTSRRTARRAWFRPAPAAPRSASLLRPLPRCTRLLQVIRQPDDALLAFLLGNAIGVMFLLSVAEMYLHNAVQHGWLPITIAFALGAGLYHLAQPFIPDFGSHHHDHHDNELEKVRGSCPAQRLLQRAAVSKWADSGERNAGHPWRAARVTALSATALLASQRGRAAGCPAARRRSQPAGQCTSCRLLACGTAAQPKLLVAQPSPACPGGPSLTCRPLLCRPGMIG